MDDKVENQTPGNDPAKSGNDPANWERAVLEKLALFAVKEQRAKRRWSIFFKLALLVIVALIIWVAFFANTGVNSTVPVGKHVALVQINGVIDANGQNSANSVNDALQKAFEAVDSVGVILKINSPGGSPVQSGMIYDEMMRLRKAHPDKSLDVVIEDMGASGGYYVASGADKIYVNRASLVGSIGVLMDGFDATELMNKVGVQRRLLTAGKNKALMDPFTKQTQEQTDYLKDMLEDIHQQFIKAVKDGRGDRLKETPDMFSGLVWTGDQAVKLGLADDFGTVNGVARDVFKVTNVVDYTETDGLPDRLLKKFGVSLGNGAVHSLLNSGMSLE